MPAGAVAGAGLAGSFMQSNAASNAAKAQTRAAQIAAATQMQMYQQTRSDLAPYRDLGQYAGKHAAEPAHGPDFPNRHGSGGA